MLPSALTGLWSESTTTPPSTTTDAATTAGGGEQRKGQGPDRRKSGIDRRTGLERRQKTAAEAGYTGPERRSGDDRKAAEEGEMTGEQFEFVLAIETYKKVNKRLYPTWTEILEIIRQLGYRKVLKRKISLSIPEPTLTKLDANGKPTNE